MKLLIIQGGFGAGGAEKIVAMLAAHRAAQGDEVHVAAMTCPPEGSYFGYPEAVTLHVLDPATGVGDAEDKAHSGVLHRMSAIRRLVRRQAPDLVISFLTKINVQTLLATFGTGAPVVISERNNVRAQGAHPVWRHAQRALMPRAAGIVMQTERACRDVPARARARTRVIANPCAPAVPPPSPRTNGLPRLSAVGRLSRQKGFDLLLEAMAPLQATWPELRLTLHGEGEERPALEAQRRALGLERIVAMPGESPHPGAWIETTDVLVLSSRFEGFPNVVAEALVNGIPVVAFDCDFGPRELIEDGVNGLLVPAGDVRALRARIDRIVASGQMRMAMGTHSERLRARLAPAAILAAWDDTIAAAGRRGAARGAPRPDKNPDADAGTDRRTRPVPVEG